MIIRGEPSPTPGVSYRIYYGIAPGQYTGCVSTSQIGSNVIGELVRGVSYHFAATAFDGTNESIPSNELSAEAPPLPQP